jgi:outer membrane protein assembly factor BamB
MQNANDLVYIGSKRSIFALDVESGQEVWRTRLPRLWGSQVTLMVDGDSLFAGRGSYIYRLDRWTGQILWEHAVAESPTYLAMIATAGGSTSSQAAASAQAAAAQTAIITAAAAGAAASAAASG